ncbi:hypothetical protein AHMF7605_08320 [Adhaeribacter arboris]|uniref:Uncharacterized protein n=1 Tax=Adhaeribacter arboris TaxID=2072846 RepID=A0A2T2YDI8_9BACT|nr:hypothetical protein [Adhaeribacter arboris]PSR53528.1 hypothetical protein AHMF7605_08320 [Adhaeribacter arboris]
MEENKEKDTKSDQRKQSTAETDVTYNRDDEDLRNSNTTSATDADPESDQVAGGDRVDDSIDGITNDTDEDTEDNS